MRQTIFTKANNLVDTVQFEGSGRGMYFYKVGKYKVTLNLSEKKTRIHNCSCKGYSVLGGVYRDLLCAHVVALIKSLPLEKESMLK